MLRRLGAHCVVPATAWSHCGLRAFHPSGGGYCAPDAEVPQAVHHPQVAATPCEGGDASRPPPELDHRGSAADAESERLLYAALAKRFGDRSGAAWLDVPRVASLRNPDTRAPDGRDGKACYIHVDTGRRIRAAFDPAMPHCGTVIFLHGLGVDGPQSLMEFRDIAACLPHIKFVFPTAPSRRMSLLSGGAAHAWFDLDRLCITNSVRGSDRPTWLEESLEYVHELIAVEQQLLAPEFRHRVVVGGFSCGGAAALAAAHTFDESLISGCFAMSGYCCARTVYERRIAKLNRRMPVLMTHGSRDPVVPLSVAKSSCHFLSGLKADTSYERAVLRNVFPKFVERHVHARVPEELTHLSRYLQQRIPGGYETSALHQQTTLRGVLRHAITDPSARGVEKHHEFPHLRHHFGCNLESFEDDRKFYSP